MQNDTVIILASGNISKKLHYIKSETACPALIPLNTKPVAAYVIDFYLKNAHQNIHLVVQNEFKEEVLQELRFYQNKIEFIFLPETKNVNDTLYHAIDYINPKNNVIVNLVTTIPTEIPELNTIILAKNIQYLVNCAYVDAETNRFYNSSNEVKDGKPFTGLFSVPSNVLKESIQHLRDQRDQIELIKALSKKTQIIYKDIDWIDCGHETNYYEAKQKLISSRSFNRVDLLQNGIVRKQSDNSEKLEQEYRYVKMLPEDLRIYFPRYFDFNKISEKTARFSMEYYGYPNVSELLLYWNLSKESWTKFFYQVKQLVLKFKTHSYSISEEAFLNFHSAKLKNRIKELEEQSPAFKTLIHSEHVINNVNCRSFYDILPTYEEKIKEIYHKTTFCIMHGDLCFNNILYDYTSGILKLIDARGSMGEMCVGIYGDVMYDLSKLAHSAIGQYDYIVNNLFLLHSKDNIHNIEFYNRKNQEFVASTCESMIKSLGFDIMDIKIIMASLFLSMPPLHKDNVEKQKAMYLHGLKLLNQNL